jgi:L-alanine-DL-glutamate epimerase-like enolase superfamily enzyme
LEEKLLKITNLRTHVLSKPFPNKIYSGRGITSARDVLIVEIETDEEILGQSFIVGTHLGNGAEIHIYDLIIRESLSKTLIGLDPLRPEEVWLKMAKTLPFGRRGASTRAISAVDLAIWDIIGKKSGLSIWRLLGGSKDRIPIYIAGGYYHQDGKSLDDLAEEMIGYVKKGCTCVKMKVGGDSVEKDTERIRVVREAIGEDIGLMLDANEAWDGFTAVNAVKRWEKFNPFWIEEPVATDDIPSLKLLRSKTNIPIAVGENAYTRHGFRDLITSEAIDIIQADAGRMGGITEWIKVAHFASVHSIKLAPHGLQEYHASLAAAIDNGMIIEYYAPDLRLQFLINEVFEEPHETKIPNQDGTLSVPDRPGLGLKINWDVVEKYRIKQAKF